MTGANRTLGLLPTARYGLLLALILLAIGARHARALPTFSRQYGVPCQTCHTVAPHLNAAGRAFQANYFRWAAGAASKSGRGLLNTLPVSGMGTFNRVENVSLGITSKADFRTLELFLADSFPVGKGQQAGGYFVDWFAANRDARAGDLGDAWVAVPVAGARGQFTLMAGQFTPMLFQYDPLNRLTPSVPVGLSGAADAFSFTDAVPGVRLDWFDNRGKGTADGKYVSVGMPYHGHLTLNKDSRLYNAHGVFLHAFQRKGGTSVGAFGFNSDSNRLGGLLGTYEPLPNLSLLGAATSAHDRFGNRRGLSLEADYTPLPLLAVTGRLESTHGIQNDTYPVLALTVYPFRQGFVRLTGETVQQKGQRTNSVYLLAQF